MFERDSRRAIDASLLKRPKLLADDLEIDLTGEVTLNQRDIISRHEKNWKIDSIHSEDSVDDQRGMQAVWVFLVDARVTES
jgi:hypothetical protein